MDTVLAAKSGAFQGFGGVQTLPGTGVQEQNKAIDRTDDSFAVISLCADSLQRTQRQTVITAELVLSQSAGFEFSVRVVGIAFSIA